MMPFRKISISGLFPALFLSAGFLLDAGNLSAQTASMTPASPVKSAPAKSTAPAELPDANLLPVLDTDELDAILALPENATADELLTFAQELETKVPRPQTQMEQMTLIEKITDAHLATAAKLLTMELSAEQKLQAIELKLNALGLKSQLSETLKPTFDAYIEELLTKEKDVKIKSLAYEMKVQGLLAGAQMNPSVLEEVNKLGQEIIDKNEESELKLLGYSILAQMILAQAENDPSKLQPLLDFADKMMKDNASVPTLYEQGAGFKMIALSLIAEKDVAQAAALETFFNELLTKELSDEFRLKVYQLRVQTLMRNAQEQSASVPQMPGMQAPQMTLNPEKLPPILALAEKMIADKSAEIKTLGISLKGSILIQLIDSDEKQLEKLNEFADTLIADANADARKQGIGFKINAYMIQAEKDKAAYDQLLTFARDMIAKETDESVKTRLSYIILQVLMDLSGDDFAKVAELETALKTMEANEELKSVVLQANVFAINAKIAQIAKTKGTKDDYQPVAKQLADFALANPLFAPAVLQGLKEGIDEIGVNVADKNLFKSLLESVLADIKAKELPADATEEAKTEQTEIIKSLESLLRFVNLPGNTIEISGLLWKDGKAFDSAVMKDKVVLIDFWSSNDRAYLQNLDNLLEIYSKIASKGFEIVSINLDASDRPIDQALESFNVNWPVISEMKTIEAGMDGNVERYAILPSTMILVGKDGKVQLIANDFDEIFAELEKTFGKIELPSPEPMGGAPMGMPGQTAPGQSAPGQGSGRPMPPRS